MAKETQILVYLRKATASRITVKNVEKCLERLLTPCKLRLVMPNQHAPDKAPIALYVSRELKRAVQKEAKARGMTVTDFVEWVLTSSTRNTVLTPDDYRKIAEETERARQKRQPDQRLRASRPASAS